MFRQIVIYIIMYKNNYYYVYHADTHMLEIRIQSELYIAS